MQDSYGPIDNANIVEGIKHMDLRDKRVLGE